jgi:hypothetical protein
MPNINETSARFKADITIDLAPGQMPGDALREYLANNDPWQVFEHIWRNRLVPDLSVTHLTDGERTALSYAFFDKQFEVRTFRDMAGRKGVISGWDDITDKHDTERFGRIHANMRSLLRFGLVEEHYDHSPSRERIIAQKGKVMTVRAAGWRYKITDAGRVWLQGMNARHYRCCDGCVVLNCVCLESTFCAEHGGGCHGSHE